jgi:hypothetical protein
LTYWVFFLIWWIITHLPSMCKAPGWISNTVKKNRIKVDLTYIHIYPLQFK